VTVNPHLQIHNVAGEPLVLDIPLQEAELSHQLAAGGRKAFTLAKDGPLSLVLLVMDKANELAEHATAGPTTIQMIDGRATLHTEGEPVQLESGQLVVLPPGAKHSIRAHERSTILVTVATLPAAGAAGGE